LAHYALWHYLQELQLKVDFSFLSTVFFVFGFHVRVCSFVEDADKPFLLLRFLDIVLSWR